MSEQQAPYAGPGESSRRRDTFRLEVEGDNLRISGEDEGGRWSHDLGPKDEAFAVMVAAMEADDFGERSAD